MVTEIPTTTDTSIALINLNVANIKVAIAEINSSIKDLSTIFSTKEELSAVAKQTEARLIKLEGSNNLWRYLTPTITALLALVFEFLLQSYIIGLHK